MHAPVLSLALMAVIFPAMQTSSPKADDKSAPSTEKARRRPATAQEALSYFRKQDWAKAVKAFEIVVRDNPNNGEHWHNYAFALHALKVKPSKPGTSRFCSVSNPLPGCTTSAAPTP
jgi:Tfp pilus assembly protein PilF